MVIAPHSSSSASTAPDNARLKKSGLLIRPCSGLPQASRSSSGSVRKGRSCIGVSPWSRYWNLRHRSRRRTGPCGCRQAVGMLSQAKASGVKHQVTSTREASSELGQSDECERDRTFPYFIKHRLRSAPPGALPGSAAGDAPASGPLRPRCADARLLVDRTSGHESSTTWSGHSQNVPPAGALRLRDERGAVRECRRSSGVRWVLSSRLPSTQAEPSSRSPWRPGRSYGGALHLDARDHARSTVCGSTADGMRAGGRGG